LYSPYALGTADYALSETKVEDTDFSVDLNKGQIEILWSNWKPAVGTKRIQVTYKAGYVNTPLTVQKLATKMVSQRILNTLIQKNVNEGNDGGSVSVGSISIVEPASYGVNSYKSLKSEIDELKKEVSSGFSMHRYTNY
jgi:hypothetical protein